MSEQDRQQRPAAQTVPARRPEAGASSGATHYYGAPYDAAAPIYPHDGAAPGSPGTYGRGYGYGEPYEGELGDGLLGAVTLERVVRVCTQRWTTIAVIVVLGAVAGFAVYRTLPSVYEASSVFEMSVSPKRYLKTDRSPYDEATSDGGQADEIIQTRLVKLRGRDVARQVVQRYRTDNPSATVSDETIREMLDQGVSLDLLRRTRLIRISVRSTDPDLATTFANAYARTVVDCTLLENRAQPENAVAWLKTTVESQRQALARADQTILDFRTAQSIDVMENDRKSAEAAIQILNADVVAIETQINANREMGKVLESLQNDPDKFVALPEAAPHSTDLITSFQRLKDAQRERNVLLAVVTAKHPEVARKEAEVVELRQEFAEKVARTRETAKEDLDLMTRRLTDLTRRREEMDRKATDLDVKIVSARTRLDGLVRERDVADLNFRNILRREQEVRLANDDNAATVTIVEVAEKPDDPVSPNPYLVLSLGPALGALLGILFVLLLDRIEGRITGLQDIEQRLRLKILAVVPHIRRARRDQVAMLMARDRFSHLAEAFAGLRNLLDSPRYNAAANVVLMVGTQPGEGKTVASSNLALACALGGHRTLLIDGDLRRPRLARIYGKNRSEFEDLAQVLASNDASRFERLPMASGYPNLDLVCTRVSSGPSPSDLLGSDAAAKFLAWARQNYDRVIIDSPPFGLLSDAIVLSKLADCTILTCCPNRTRLSALRRAVHDLADAGGRVIGVLVNNVDFGAPGMLGRYDPYKRYAHVYGAETESDADDTERHPDPGHEVDVPRRLIAEDATDDED